MTIWPNGSAIWPNGRMVCPDPYDNTIVPCMRGLRHMFPLASPLRASLGLLLVLLTSLPAAAQESKVRLYFSDRKDTPTDKLTVRAPRLRPGGEHALYVFVRNDEAQERAVKVEVRAG